MEKLLAKLAAPALKLCAVTACVGTIAGVYLFRAPEDPRSVAVPRGSAPAARSAPAGSESEAVRTPTPEQPRPEPAARATSNLRPAQRARASSAETPAPADRRAAGSLRSEIELLFRVQAALKRGDGAAALQELDAHETTDRALLAERQAARILALCMVGRVTEARSAAADFAHQHPDSPHQQAIASSCANPKRIQAP